MNVTRKIGVIKIDKHNALCYKKDMTIKERFILYKKITKILLKIQENLKEITEINSLDKIISKLNNLNRSLEVRLPKL